VLPLPSATTVSAAGYMLETPSIRSVLAQVRSENPTVRTISRKDSGFGLRILRDHTPAFSSEKMRWSGPYGDIGRSAEMTGPPVEQRAFDIGLSNRSSEIPCRVSSDLHEWRNDLGTVSTRDSAKLQCE
jgi:hypothetical protein